MLTVNPLNVVGDVVSHIFNTNNRELAHEAGIARKQNEEYPHYTVTDEGLQTLTLPPYVLAQHYFALFANNFREEPGH